MNETHIIKLPSASAKLFFCFFPMSNFYRTMMVINRHRMLALCISIFYALILNIPQKAASIIYTAIGPIFFFPISKFY